MNDEELEEAAAVASDIVAIGSSLIPFAGPAVAAAAQAITNRETRRQLAHMKRLYERLEGRIEKLEAAANSEEGRDLLLDSIQLAAITDEGEPAELLVRVVADAIELGDPASIRQADLMLDVISQLRREHIELLRELGTIANSPGILVLHMAQKWTIYALENRLPDLKGVVDALLGRLAGFGLAYQTGTLNTSTPERPGPQPQWGLSLFGLQLMGYLYESEELPV